MKQNLILLTVILTAFSAFSAEYYVDAARPDDSGDGASWATAKQTIQAAVDLAADGDTVLATNGTYILSSEISVTNAITIRSVNGPDVTVVDGNGVTRGFNLHDSACLISGFTIMNGSSWDGVGVYCDSTAPSVSNCTFNANVAYTGLGSYGGGMYRGRAYNCTFTGNSACFGGGLAEGNAYGCVFSNNTVNSVSLQQFGHGGGQYKGEALGCIFIENTSDFVGGGIALGSASECLFINNSAAANGGGMSSGEALNCTFINNSAYRGGGMSAGSVGGTNSIAYNCIFSGNTAADDGDDLLDSMAYSSCSPELTNGVNGNITNAPLFVDAANGNFRLQAGSPCINAGSNGYVQGATDLNGRDRILNGTVDMGAYEHLIAYVSADSGSDSSSGQSWTNAKQTIQAAADLAIDGDIVWVTNGTYVLSAEISVTNAITIRSVNGPDVTVVDGNNSNRCFNLTNNCRVSGFTITGGSAFNEYEFACGGGVYCTDASSLVSNCVISGNLVGSAWNAGSGGGMYGGTAYNCIFSGNTVGGWENRSSGGGMSDGSAYGCIFSANTASFGGGMSGSIASNCTFLGNYSDAYGGGGMSDGTAYNCIFSNNAAAWGSGGMSGGTAYNCLFTKNSGHGGGGMSLGTAYGCLFNANDSGIFGGGGMSHGTSYNCTFVDNKGRYGAGISDGTAYNCVFSGNTADAETLPADFYNSTAYNSCSLDLEHGVNGNITNAPLFVDEANGDFRLQSNSPCINWGNNSVVSNSTDLAGNPRIVEGVVDMGAYEYQGIVGLADSDADGIADDWERQYGGNQNPDATCSNGVNTIREAYIAGLDPNDEAAFFKMDGNRTAGKSVLWWNATSGRVYSVYFSTNLMNGFQPLETNIPWTAGAFTDSVHNTERQLFYKVDVQLAP